ncbi:hypothetical protein B0T10DRAFT_136010 [Thelonectria olida]|uniref:Uncharacterized protein n=1 Tax=Thelonectria olida TaxID=1576542 RepID=A0A9P9APA2_9HYPO|nr:hypothetical protein B0T10DRAFT_136010 [Thelonectria olida]
MSSHNMGRDDLATPLQVDLDLVHGLISRQQPQDLNKVTPDRTRNRGQFSFFSSVQGSIVERADLTSLFNARTASHDYYELPRSDDGFWWLDVSAPTKAQVDAICTAFGIHPLTAEDIGAQEGGEKVEIFPSYYFASFRSFKTVQEDDGVEYAPFNVYVVVFRTGALSFSFAPNNHALHVRSRIAATTNYPGLNSDWICYALIDDIVDSFVPPIHQLERDVDTIEDEVFVIRDADTRPFFKSMGQARNTSTALLRLLGDKADVLRRLTKRCDEASTAGTTTPRKDIGMNLDDVQDHVLTMTANLGHFETILGRAHSNYLATLRINKLSQDIKTNRFLGKITLVAGVCIPLQLIGSIWGMNVLVPFQTVDGLGPFFGICGFIALASMLMLSWAKWKKLV